MTLTKVSLRALWAAALMFSAGSPLAAQAQTTLSPPAAAESTLSGPRPLSEGVAAIVNDDIISSYDLRQRTMLLLLTSGVQPTQETIPQIEREALRSLIDERLERQDIQRIESKNKIKLQPTDEELNQEISELAKQNNSTGDALLSSFRAAGVDPQTLRDQLRIQTAWRRYIGGRFGSSVRVSDQQIKEYQKRLLANAQKEQYHTSQVFIEASRVGGQTAAEEGARQLVTQIKAGAPFAAVARQFSSLPTGANGGDAGWLTASELPPALLPVVEKMRPGQLSDPISVQDGVYIVFLREKRTGAGSTVVRLKQAAVRLDANAKPEAVQAAQASLASLRTKLTGCDNLEAVAAKTPGVVAGDFGEVNPGDLRPEFQQAVNTLKPGEISQPLRTNAGLHLLAMCERKLGGAQALSRDDVENRIYGEQLSMIARRYLRDLRNSATIEAR